MSGGCGCEVDGSGLLGVEGDGKLEAVVGEFVDDWSGGLAGAGQ